MELRQRNGGNVAYLEVFRTANERSIQERSPVAGPSAQPHVKKSGLEKDTSLFASLFGTLYRLGKSLSQLLHGGAMAGID